MVFVPVLQVPGLDSEYEGSSTDHLAVVLAHLFGEGVTDFWLRYWANGVHVSGQALKGWYPSLGVIATASHILNDKLCGAGYDRPRWYPRVEKPLGFTASTSDVEEEPDIRVAHVSAIWPSRAKWIDIQRERSAATLATLADS